MGIDRVWVYEHFDEVSGISFLPPQITLINKHLPDMTEDL